MVLLSKRKISFLLSTYEIFTVIVVVVVVVVVGCGGK
jgi:hypothetical protein